MGTSQGETTDDPSPRKRVSMRCCKVKSVFETIIKLAAMGAHVLERPEPDTRGSCDAERAEEGYGWRGPRDT